MNKIVVTGGAGFIGSHLCEELLKRGNYVICVDNFFTGSMKNIDHLRKNNNFEVIRHDITLPLFVECDQIYNLACPASPVHYQHNPIKTIKCNTVGMVNMLGLAKRTGAIILQASTSEVYGDPLEHPQKENYWGNVNPIGVRSCYDEGKRVAEALCMDYHRQNKVDVRIIRIFNTYGPRMAKDDGRVVSNFIVQALKSEDITVYGDGKQTRSFQYVSDLVEGMIKMMEHDDFIGPVNLGNPDEFTMLELVEKVLDLTGSSSKIVFKELPKDDPTRRKPDISLAKEKLKWEPVVKLEIGLKDTIDYFSTV
ncbi:MAG: SDR family oxidoreductase [Nanoarchaeota archaeon]|nr:SDR family oxidoreductase [Nanoarchaeota archaeon]MBU1644185.1 SDR family oxidoreductase [Nanoarchaeota archaeon]MBU1976817.1 SDR family oxidoreductase [Nanoarchaeota archaeon]